MDTRTTAQAISLHHEVCAPIVMIRHVILINIYTKMYFTLLTIIVVSSINRILSHNPITSLSDICIYLYRGEIRYKYTHAIPTNENSLFKGEHIIKQRRVSVISRTQP